MNISEHDLRVIREHFAREATAGLDVTNAEKISKAFCSVAREQFLHPPPWRVQHGKFGRQCKVVISNAVSDLYRDVLVEIDPERSLNNGLPSLWAYILDFCGDWSNAKTALHLGCGTGYYTAVISQLMVGGVVYFDEIDDRLFSFAQEALSGYRNAVPGMAAGPCDMVIYSFGVSVLDRTVVDALTDGGVIVAPVVDQSGQGRIVRLEKNGRSLNARVGAPCFFYLDQKNEKFSGRYSFRDMEICIPSKGNVLLSKSFC